MNSKILLIGAYERDNFGDLLFAKIFEKVLHPYQTIKGSLVGRDLTKIGGDQVVSARSWVATQLTPPAAVIHCGGETLACPQDVGINFDLAPEFLSPIQGKFIPHQTKISQTLTGTTQPFAYVTHHHDLWPDSHGKNFRPPIAFFSVGGSALDQLADQPEFLPALGERLQAAQFVAVRDKVTQACLKKYFNLEAHLYPDVVSIVAQTHQEEMKQACLQSHIHQIVTGQPYVLFQANQATINQYGAEIFAHQLVAIARAYHLAIVLQPAGLCQGHDLLEQFVAIAELIKKLAPEVKVTIQKDRFLWSQVAIIAHATCAIASSLHVRIVASSFAKPCISLPNTKVATYVTSWENTQALYNIQPKDLLHAVGRALLTDQVYYRQLAKTHSEAVIAGLKALKHTLGLGRNEESEKIGRSNERSTEIFAALSYETDALRETVVTEVIARLTQEEQAKQLQEKLHTLDSRVTELQVIIKNDQAKQADLERQLGETNDAREMVESALQHLESDPLIQWVIHFRTLTAAMQDSWTRKVTSWRNRLERLGKPEPTPAPVFSIDQLYRRVMVGK